MEATIAVLLTLDEAAAKLRKTPAALRYMIQKRTAPRSALIGGRRMFRASDIEAYIEAQFAEAS